mmetsp:Transcript_32876/g.50271  ORF Transcript_32876/g.50271 Transcript_32876/m.50271 type:complete len:112 (+) Transcript_32876:157-492(+)
MGDLTDNDAIPSAMDFIPSVPPKKKSMSKVEKDKSGDQTLRRSSRLSKNLSQQTRDAGNPMKAHSILKAPSNFSCDKFLAPGGGAMQKNLSKLSKWSDVNPLSRYQSKVGV